MTSQAELRGTLRRYVLAHTIAWVVFTAVLLGFFSRHASWGRAWVFIPPFAISAVAVPGFLRFRRVALQVGYSGWQIIRQYLLGTSADEYEEMLQSQAERQAEWGSLLDVVGAEAPELLSRTEQLREQDKLEAAHELLERSKQQRRRLEQEHQARIDGCRAEAVKLHCGAMVEPFLAAGDFVSAKAAIDETARLIARAKQFGLENAVVDLLDGLTSPDFSQIHQLIKSVENTRTLSRIEADYRSRIAAAPDEVRPKLLDQLRQLVGLPLGSRDFRKTEHDLELELGRAISAS